jgi:hypothetical protein
MSVLHSADGISSFFSRSDDLDYLVLRPLSHIAPNWEATWTGAEYEPESGSFAADLNTIIALISDTPSPKRYHDNEDTLAERVMKENGWPIQKKGKLWIGADYQSILEQGSFADLEQQDLIIAASGRVHAAIKFGQNHFDEMEDAHKNMLAGLLTIIIYHRSCDGTSLYYEDVHE